MEWVSHRLQIKLTVRLQMDLYAWCTKPSTSCLFWGARLCYESWVNSSSLWSFCPLQTVKKSFLHYFSTCSAGVDEMMRATNCTINKLNLTDLNRIGSHHMFWCWIVCKISMTTPLMAQLCKHHRASALSHLKKTPQISLYTVFRAQLRAMTALLCCHDPDFENFPLWTGVFDLSQYSCRTWFLSNNVDIHLYTAPDLENKSFVKHIKRGELPDS